MEVPGDPSDLADEALLTRPDGAALAELDRRYRERVWGWVHRRHHDDDLADEVASGTLARLWEQRDRFDPERGTAAAWVFVLARTVCADALRQRRRAPIPTAILEEDTGHGGPGDAADLAEAIVTRAVVAELLDRLSPDHRVVIELAFVEGLTQATIASRLGLPLGTVKTRTFYGLRVLRLAAEEYGVNFR